MLFVFVALAVLCGVMTFVYKSLERWGLMAFFAAGLTANFIAAIYLFFSER